MTYKLHDTLVNKTADLQNVTPRNCAIGLKQVSEVCIHFFFIKK